MRTQDINEILSKFSLPDLSFEASLPMNHMEAEQQVESTSAEVTSEPLEIPINPNIFRNHMCAVPSHPVVTNVIKSIHAANGDSVSWGDKSKQPLYTGNWDGGRASMIIKLAGISNTQDPWESIAQMDDLMVDVMILGLAQWLYTAKNHEESIWIGIDQILDSRGIQPKHKNGYKAGHRELDRQGIIDCFELLDKMYFRAYGVTDYRRNDRPKKVSIESKVLAITDRVIDDRDIVAVKVRPGEYGKYLFGYDRRQTALLYKRILEYDYYRYQWEKRIGLYLSLQWSIRKAHGTINQSFKVGTIIDKVHLPINERHPKRTRDRLEQAFGKLVSDGIITTWCYKNGENDDLPKNEWLSSWLQWTIEFGVPETIIQHYNSVRQNRQKLLGKKH